MTRAVSTKYYSAQFFELAELLSKKPDEVVTLHFDSVKDARAFRLEFYTFRACAEREGLALEYPELCALTVRMEGNTIHVLHKDYTPSALALKNALEKAAK